MTYSTDLPSIITLKTRANILFYLIRRMFQPHFRSVPLLTEAICVLRNLSKDCKFDGKLRNEIASGKLNLLHSRISITTSKCYLLYSGKTLQTLLCILFVGLGWTIGLSQMQAPRLLVLLCLKYLTRRPGDEFVCGNAANDEQTAELIGSACTLLTHIAFNAPDFKWCIAVHAINPLILLLVRLCWISKPNLSFLLYTRIKTNNCAGHNDRHQSFPQKKKLQIQSYKIYVFCQATV